MSKEIGKKESRKRRAEKADKQDVEVLVQTVEKASKHKAKKEPKHKADKARTKSAEKKLNHKAEKLPKHKAAKALKQNTEKPFKNSSGKEPKNSRGSKTSKARSDRDPVAIIEQTNIGRDQLLVPTRHSRMLVSPFSFYRGAAAIMANDLALEESSGIIVQSCGDCHILNFGAFATPERNIIVDFNDFDETHPAPFEWDLKRLAASFVTAANVVGISGKVAEKAAFELTRSYQEEMAKHAKGRLLDVWFSKLELQTLIDNADKEDRERVKKQLSKELTKSTPEVLHQKLTEKKNGSWRFKEIPPLLYHVQDIDMKNVRSGYDLYLQSLSADKQALLKHFEIVDIARKVVGTGSVGTFCAVALLVSGNDDLLVLQVKEARSSVLEPYLEACKFENHGERVVTGQRIMQSASDMFLGWTKGKNGRHFYLRQLRDVKMSPNPALWSKSAIVKIAQHSGKVLAKGHAKSGEAPAISEFLGTSEKFATSMANYALSYAERTSADYRLFAEACRSKRIATEASAVG